MRISFLEYDTTQDAYKITYELKVKPGVYRRTTATFKNGVLSRDNSNKKLLALIKENISLIGGKK